MKRLTINFAPSATHLPWLGAAILLPAVMLTIVAAIVHHRLDEQVEALSYRVERLKHALAREADDLEATQNQRAASDNSSETMRRAWPQLFDALGEQLGESVTLLSIHGSADSDHLDLQCEAKDQEAMFALIGRLESNKFLTDVSIQSHETVRDNPYRPVRFTLVASWKKSP